MSFVINKKYFLFALAFIFLWLFSNINNAHAARIIKFYGSGDNTALYGEYYSSPNPSTCKITLNNQSGVDQTYTITLATSTAATGTGSGSITQDSNPDGLTLTGSPLTYTTTLSTATSHNYTFTYPDFPAYTAGTQHVECNGSISIEDTVAGSPGSLGFNGLINTFSEELQYTDTVTAGTKKSGSRPMPGFVPLSTSQN